MKRKHKNVDELKTINLPKKTLPLNNEYLKYVLSLRDVKVHHVVQLAETVHELWDKAECCPFDVRTIRRMFESNVWEKYLALQKQSAPGRKHYSNKEKNLQDTNKNEQSDKVEKVPGITIEVKPPEKKQKIIETRLKDTNDMRTKWDIALKEII